MAEINYRHYSGADIYNDGDAEAYLLDFYRGAAGQPEETDEFFYLTTHIRENILNWYPFSKEDEVLEIGCGCGTLTDMLCRKCAAVYSVEGSRRRAEITYERNKSHENLYVYAGEFGRFTLDKTFDYVILIGVFEYAKRFFRDCQDPVRRFLRAIQSALKPEGKVLLAIENRYGLKYWAGADEDHLRKPYVGLADYDQYDVQTFGAQELRSLCEEMGWSRCKFYYPFPDYKLPEVIYSGEYLPDRGDISLLPIYLYGNHANFDIRGAFQGLRDNSQFGFFSNSFLLECGAEESKLADVSYAKELSYRTEPYRTITVKSGTSGFKKIAATGEAVRHLRAIHANHVRIAKNRIRTVATEMTDGDELWVETAEGQKLADRFHQYASARDEDGFVRELNVLRDYYRQISTPDFFREPACGGLLSLYPPPPMKIEILNLSLVDANAANIIIDRNGEYVLIDQEWILEKQLPAEYLMFYSILHICNVCEIQPKRYLDMFGITDEKQAVFQQITDEFYRFNRIVDSRLLKRKEDLNWRWVADEGKALSDVCPVCYYDTGCGFNENQKIYGTYEEEEGIWTAVFQLPEDTVTVRIDPALCGEKCLYYTSILINGKTAICSEHNIITWGEKKMLSQRNPYVVLEQAETSFEMKIDLKQLSIAEVEGYFHFLNS